MQNFRGKRLDPGLEPSLKSIPASCRGDARMINLFASLVNANVQRQWSVVLSPSCGPLTRRSLAVVLTLRTYAIYDCRKVILYGLLFLDLVRSTLFLLLLLNADQCRPGESCPSERRRQSIHQQSQM